MTTDIEELIDRLHSVTTETAGDQAAVDEAADALTRLVAPLPAEVAGCIGRLEAQYFGVHSAEMRNAAARLLESLARENARLAADYAAVAHAAGIEYVADGHASEPGPVDALVRAIEEMRRNEGSFQEAEGKAERLAAENAELLARREEGRRVMGCPTHGEEIVHGDCIGCVRARADALQELLDASRSALSQSGAEARADGRLDGIREAMATMREMSGDYGPYAEELVAEVAAHLAIVSRHPPSGGAKEGGA